MTSSTDYYFNHENFIKELESKLRSGDKFIIMLNTNIHKKPIDDINNFTYEFYIKCYMYSYKCSIKTFKSTLYFYA